VAAPARRQIDARSLQGLAHPLRARMLELLGLHGSATATQLAAKVGESSGVTSYHLRQLEKFGFIEEDPDRGTGRERWWRRVPGGLQLSSREFDDDPVAREAAMIVVNEWARSKQARLDYFRATYESWPEEWLDASIEASVHLRLTADELKALNEELDAVTTRYHDRAAGRDGDDRYVDVEIQINSLPLGDPPAPREV
jgi:DNA-binding transcriptional ArsR family regulator